MRNRAGNLGGFRADAAGRGRRPDRGEAPGRRDYETVAGLIGFELGRVPGRGDSVRVEATNEEKEPLLADLYVLRMDGLRVDRVRLVVSKPQPEEGWGGREVSTPLALMISLLLLAGNAFFVGAEFALISARRSVIELRADEGGWAARITLHAMERVAPMMAGAQLGITLCPPGWAPLAEPAIAHALEHLRGPGHPRVTGPSGGPGGRLVPGRRLPRGARRDGPEEHRPGRSGPFRALALGPPIAARWSKCFIRSSGCSTRPRTGSRGCWA